MSEKHRKGVDFAQNITIALLSVCAVFLFSRTEIFRLGWEAGRGYFQLFPDGVLTVRPVTTSTPLTAPLRYCVSTGYAYTGDISSSTGDERFLPLRRLLGGALSQELSLSECGEAEFHKALSENSIYFDFLQPLPLSVLAGLMDGTSDREDSVRRIILCRSETSARLYLTDDARYLTGTVSLDDAVLEEALGSYEPVSFAKDILSPYTLLPEATPQLPLLTAESGVPDSDQLLTSLGFNPLTNSRYPEANGTEVVIDGGRSLRLRPGGSIYYQGGGRSELTVECAGETPTAWEAARGCAILLDTILSQTDALFWVREVHRVEENTLVIRYGYQQNGVPIQFSDGGCAAEVVLDGPVIESLELRPRRYAVTEEVSYLLPLPQALGIAELTPGAEMSLCYADSGTPDIVAAWVT